LIVESDKLPISFCNFKILSVPHPCKTAKWSKQSAKILINGNKVILNEFSGLCYNEENVFQSLAVLSSMQRKVMGR